MHPRYRVAEHALRDAARTGASLCEPLRTAFEVADAGVSTLGPPFGARMVCAAGATAAVFGELQIDLGQGPAWDAFTTGRPVLVRRLVAGDRWPLLVDRAAGLAIESVYSFPLRAAGIDIGAICLSVPTARRMSEEQLVAAAALVPLTGRAVLARAMRAMRSDVDTDGFSLREVHQATGMIAAQLRVAPEEALLALRAHAFATSRPVREVAAEIVGRRLDLSRD